MYEGVFLNILTNVGTLFIEFYSTKVEYNVFTLEEVELYISINILQNIITSGVKH